MQSDRSACSRPVYALRPGVQSAVTSVFQPAKKKPALRGRFNAQPPGNHLSYNNSTRENAAPERMVSFVKHAHAAGGSISQDEFVSAGLEAEIAG